MLLLLFYASSILKGCKTTFRLKSWFFSLIKELCNIFLIFSESWSFSFQFYDAVFNSRIWSFMVKNVCLLRLINFSTSFKNEFTFRDFLLCIFILFLIVNALNDPQKFIKFFSERQTETLKKCKINFSWINTHFFQWRTLTFLPSFHSTTFCVVNFLKNCNEIIKINKY